MEEVKYSYNGRFDGNILVVGRTGCGKTTFVRNLQKKKLFGDIKEIFLDIKNCSFCRKRR